MVEVCPGFARQDTRALGPDREQQIPRRAEALLVMTTRAGKQKRRSRSCDVDHAHGAAHLADGDVFVLLHPALHPRQHDAEVLDAVLQERGGHHGNVGAGHHALQYVTGVVHAAGDGDVGLYLVIQNGCPVETETQLVWAAQYQVRCDLHLLQVEIRLIKAVEDDHPIGSRFRQLLDEVCT
jgi:hypothetical protein